MKNVKLKPLYLRSNEILIQPPSFIKESSEYSLKPNASMKVTSVENLKHAIKVRNLQTTPSGPPKHITEEKETVAKLSDFKPRMRRYAKSPLIRRYTFRRTISNLNLDGALTLSPSPKKVAEERPTLAKLMQIITSNERGKVKNLEIEMQNYSKSNQEYEDSLMSRLDDLKDNIERASREINKSKTDVEATKERKIELARDYQGQVNSIAFKQTEHALSVFRVNGKKKLNMEVSEEREYFTLKEQLRKAKSDLHANFVENSERLNEVLEMRQTVLEGAQEKKKQLLKELKELQEIMLAFHCNNLKEGMDLRDDGIRWCIKAIWNMNQPVPISSFPKFLDEESAEFLLVVAQIDLQVNELEKKLTVIRDRLKDDRLDTSISKTSLEMVNSVRGRLRIISQKSKNIYTGRVHTEENEENSIREESVEKFNEIDQLKNGMRELNNTKTHLSAQEIKRIVENYSTNKRNNEVGLLHVIKCLVGEKSRDFRKLTQIKPVKRII